MIVLIYICLFFPIGPYLNFLYIWLIQIFAKLLSVADRCSFLDSVSKQLEF